MTQPSTYDSRPDTLLHSLRVGQLMAPVIAELADRAVRHDLSKTQPPEVDLFDEYTPWLRGMTYGSPQYTASLRALGPALAHHYAHNRHHPEHHQRGVRGMTLMDLVEMLCDWRASTERHADGDLLRSLTINQQRFGISEDLLAVLLNTAVALGWVPAGAELPHASWSGQTPDTAAADDGARGGPPVAAVPSSAGGGV